MGTSHWALLVSALAVAGCNGGGDRAEQAPDSAGVTGHMDSGGMGMGGMPMQGMKMMPQMRAHLDSLAAMDAGQMTGVMAAHQDLASRMLDAMGADMRRMNMKPDSTWAALSDSLQQDLANLPSLSGAALKTRMEGHIERMRRMLGMHEGMMRM